MANDYIDQWDLNTVVYDIHDKGRGQANGVATLDSNSKVPDTQLGRGVANGVASLDSNGRIPYSQLPEDALELKGYWDASTNTPQLADGTGTSGDFYFVDVAGSQDLGSGTQYFAVGDRVLYDGSIWKNIASGTVRTINGSGPDAQGNISGVVKSVNTVTPDATGDVTLSGLVKSVNTVTPDASGNVTISSISSVNGIAPDATGNIKIGGVSLPSVQKQYSWGSLSAGSSLSDADWADLCDRASKCLYLEINVAMQTYDRSSSSYTTVMENTKMKFLVTYISDSTIYLCPISPSVIRAVGGSTAYGWTDAVEWYLHKTVSTFAQGQVSQLRGQAVNWSNSFDALFYRVTNMYIYFYNLNVSNS